MNRVLGLEEHTVTRERQGDSRQCGKHRDGMEVL